MYYMLKIPRYLLVICGGSGNGAIEAVNEAGKAKLRPI